MGADWRSWTPIARRTLSTSPPSTPRRAAATRSSSGSARTTSTARRASSATRDKGKKVIVEGDIKGNGKADFEIFVKVGKLTDDDFVR